MKTLRLLMVVLQLSVLSAVANEADFQHAQTAYDGGRYAEAVLLYNNLLDDGMTNPEVHYNLANAYFKDSDLPNAVWHYRKASYSAPRDPDIRANLHFALNAAGAIEPVPSFTERVLFAVSLNEWILIAVCSYIVLALLLLLALLLKPARRNLLKLCLLPTALILLSFAGWRDWSALHQNPEWVVTQTEATALFGPVEGSTAHYKLPLAALVQQRSADSKGWVKVEYDGKRGWIKSDYISRVSP